MTDWRVTICKEEWEEAKRRFMPAPHTGLKRLLFGKRDEPPPHLLGISVMNRRRRFGESWYDRYTERMLAGGRGSL